MTEQQFTDLMIVLKRIEAHLETIIDQQEEVKANMFNRSSVKPEEYEKVKELVRKNKEVSPAFLQRTLQIGYAHAARLLDLLEEDGIVSAALGSQPRKVLAVEPNK